MVQVWFFNNYMKVWVQHRDTKCIATLGTHAYMHLQSIFTKEKIMWNEMLNKLENIDISRFFLYSELNSATWHVHIHVTKTFY